MIYNESAVGLEDQSGKHGSSHGSHGDEAQGGSLEGDVVGDGVGVGNVGVSGYDVGAGDCIELSEASEVGSGGGVWHGVGNHVGRGEAGDCLDSGVVGSDGGGGEGLGEGNHGSGDEFSGGVGTSGLSFSSGKGIVKSCNRITSSMTSPHNCKSVEVGSVGSN